MPDRPPRDDRLGGRDDRVGVDTVMAIKLGNRSGLAEMFDPEWPHPMAVDRTEPGERRRVPVDDGHDPAMGRHFGEDPFDMRTGVDETAFARAQRRGPAG